MKKILLSAVIALSVSAPAYAASGNTSTDTGSAAANVVTPIVLTHTTGATLNFGSFTTGTGGTVVVGPDGTGSTTSDVAFVPNSTEAADQFTVKGDNSRSFAISTGGGNVAFGSTTIAFTTSVTSPTATLSATGTAAFGVGGTLTLHGSEGPGTYTGTYNATVTYN